MTDFPIAYTLHRHGAWSNAYDLVTLSHDERFLRRKRLVTARGEGFLVNLVETISLSHGDALALEDGRLIEVISAPETVLMATADFARLARHSASPHTVSDQA